MADFQEQTGEGDFPAHRSELEIVMGPPRSVSENLAEDEERMRSAASDRRNVLRLWWAKDPAVVLGRSEKIEQVADPEACERLGVEILRRSTGGGTVLLMPGVLSYSLTGPAPGLPDIRALFKVGSRLLVEAVARLGIPAEARGISDVAVGDRKISGNAMAKRWGGLLLHGTLIWDLDFDLVDACLRHPPREPDYRHGRGHRDFITTLRSLGAAATPDQVELAVLAAARDLAEAGKLNISPYFRR